MVSKIGSNTNNRTANVTRGSLSSAIALFKRSFLAVAGALSPTCTRCPRG
jgi:hypothetical protein